MIYDFIGMDAMGWNPMERLGAYLWNRSWSRRPLLRTRGWDEEYSGA